MLILHVNFAPLERYGQEPMQKDVEETGSTYIVFLGGGIYLNRRVYFNTVRENNVYFIEGKQSTAFPSCMLFSDRSERAAEKVGMGFERSESR